ncbi:transcriptional regulator, ArsR family [Desulfofarcimen acetoxidans DSM 771]|jgi:DNA-binding transcriptional ArsR family regulator|uniref:Transcriptional regulator, ArsR family n=1 Tax=Desulfofarcimen acetoxidans (strain ATCC 49208 / DSM 771 / KCTC 5769 / VKM B-1644 / 5575) TaxID=485916 RepID=C8VX22_DESAS|nr:metalloregulator ArsR/SmtB family transcription factor [Desulfofarcimen acetoxidans]ACV62598.1 transcriptional regulator, ArsR family [Desulfofarcimen acetoxidans DSM 771]
MNKEELTCEIECINTEVVNEIKKYLPDIEEVQKLSAIYKALGDPTRFKILFCLKQEEMCVCDISAILDMSQSAISHQLRVLRNLRIVKYRKEGKMVFYSLDDKHIFRILDEGINHIRHE